MSCSATLSVIAMHCLLAAAGFSSSIANASCTKRSSFSDAPLRFMQTKSVRGSSAWWLSIQDRVVLITQRSMTEVRPLFSAAATMRPAGITLPSWSRMRSSTSKLSEPCGALSDMIGCMSRNRPSGLLCVDRRSTSWNSASRSRNTDADLS